MTKDKLHSLLTRLFIILLFFTFASAAYLLLPDKKGEHKNNTSQFLETDKLPTGTIKSAQTNTEVQLTDTNKNEVIATPTPANGLQTRVWSQRDKTTTTAATSTPLLEQNLISVTIIIQKQQYPLQVASQTSVYAAMQKLSQQQKITFTAKEFTGMGYFIESINNIQNDTRKNKYWIYYINRQSAKVGVSQTILKQNDVIEWKYEEAKY